MSGRVSKRAKERPSPVVWETKVLVLLIFALIEGLGISPIGLLVLSLSSALWCAYAASRRQAIMVLCYMLVAWPLYVALIEHGWWPPFVSPIIIYNAGRLLPVGAAFGVVVSSPPGLISQSLAHAGLPKKAILGTLVFLRFFPTFASTWRLLKDALRKRGLARPLQVLSNPLDTYEYMLVPIMMALVNSADQLASSAVTRAAESPLPRTSYYAQRASAHDVIGVLSAACACGAALLAGQVVA